MKTLLTILILMTLVSCEGGSGGSGDSSSGSSSESNNEADITITDVSAEYYGTYLSECVVDADLEFGSSYIAEVVLSAGVPEITYSEYSAANCTGLVAEMRYEVDFKVLGNQDEETLVWNYEIELEYTDSYLNVAHVGWTGYWDCGFTQTIGVEYNVHGTGCQADWENDDKTFDFNPISSTVIEIDDEEGNPITMTKQ